ncbi:MAG: hypothetical protein EOO50_06295 [Flavobacterium sp.]|uniref:hypothetical protein n=1 Tax=Flavobacterium sp. TaxID=239 RepID=UPI00122575D8|nr:hypothetical protein [Flavobacterium sp.]RZJ67351.1 MAG: hypothetical protein EOO50_06295 [Flavobacterium sp.]
MKTIFLMLLALPVLAFSQKKETIPFSSQDFLQLVHKYYKDVPILKDGYKSYDAAGIACYLLTTDQGDLYYLYENDVLKFNSGDTSVEIYLVGTNVAMFVVQMTNDHKYLVYSVNGEAKSKLKG